MSKVGRRGAHYKLTLRQRVWLYAAAIATPVARWVKTFVLDTLDRTVRVGLGFVLGFLLGIVAISASLEALWPIISGVARVLAWIIRLLVRLMA